MRNSSSFSIAYQSAMQETVEKFSDKTGQLVLQIGGYKKNPLVNNQWRPEDQTKDDGSDDPEQGEGDGEDGEMTRSPESTGPIRSLGDLFDIDISIDSGTTPQTPSGNPNTNYPEEDTEQTESAGNNSSERNTEDISREESQEGSILDPLVDIRDIPISGIEYQTSPDVYTEPISELMYGVGTVVTPIPTAENPQVLHFDCDGYSYAIDAMYFPPRIYKYYQPIVVYSTVGDEPPPLHPLDIITRTPSGVDILSSSSVNNGWEEVDVSDVPCGIAGIRR